MFTKLKEYPKYNAAIYGTSDGRVVLLSDQIMQGVECNSAIPLTWHILYRRYGSDPLQLERYVFPTYAEDISVICGLENNKWYTMRE